MPTNSRIKVEVDKDASFATKSPPAVPSKPKEAEQRPHVVPHTQQALDSLIGVASYPPSVPQVTSGATAGTVSSAAMLAPVQTVSSHLLTQAPSVVISPQNLLRDPSQGHSNMHIHDVQQSIHPKSVKVQSVAFQNPYQTQIMPPIVKIPNRTLPPSVSRNPSSTQNEAPVSTSSLDRLGKISNVPSNQDGQHEVGNSLPSNQSQDFDDQESTSQIATVENPQWIFGYKLPEFPRHIAEKLDNKENLDNVERTALLSRLYESVTKHTFYPTTSDYNIITDKLLQRFPHLYDLPGPIRPDHTPWEVWKNRIMHKFKNQRKRKDRHRPAVQMRKRMQILTAKEMMGAQYQDIGCKADHGRVGVDEIKEVIIKDEDEEEEGSGFNEYHVMVADTTELEEVS